MDRGRARRRVYDLLDDRVDGVVGHTGMPPQRGAQDIEPRCDHGRADHLLNHGGDGGVRDGAISEADTDEDVRAVIAAVYELVKTKDVQEYIEEMLSAYARYFAVGVANLLNLLDLDHVVLGGGVMDALWPIGWFRKTVDEELRERALDAPYRRSKFAHDPFARPGWAWEGAALLFRDPGYEAVRKGVDADTEQTEHHDAMPAHTFAPA